MMLSDNIKNIFLIRILFNVYLFAAQFKVSKNSYYLSYPTASFLFRNAVFPPISPTEFFLLASFLRTWMRTYFSSLHLFLYYAPNLVCFTHLNFH